MSTEDQRRAVSILHDPKLPPHCPVSSRTCRSTARGKEVIKDVANEDDRARTRKVRPAPKATSSPASFPQDRSQHIPREGGPLLQGFNTPSPGLRVGNYLQSSRRIQHPVYSGPPEDRNHLTRRHRPAWSHLKISWQILVGKVKWLDTILNPFSPLQSIVNMPTCRTQWLQESFKKKKCCV